MLISRSEHEENSKASVTTRLPRASLSFKGQESKHTTRWQAPYFGGRVGVVVRALAFHQCGPGSISALGVKCGLSLLVLYSAMRGFSPVTPVFPSHQKPTFDLI